MIAIESGGTKSTWIFKDKDNQLVSITSVGLHPRELSIEKDKKISEVIEKYNLRGQSVYFYGAGCESVEAKAQVRNYLEKYTLKVEQIETDIFAACLAHLGNQSGFVGILGTGAVAAAFDGEKVLRLTSGLGYILGDEGSGFDIGKRLLQSYFKKELPDFIREDIDASFNHQSILHRIHASDGRFVIADLSKIAYKWCETPAIQEILTHAFTDFCVHALQPLNPDKPIHFIGSVAYHFRTVLETVLLQNGFQLGNVKKEAIQSVYSILDSEI